MSKNDQKVELPSVLSFERKLETSDALMHSGIWGEKVTQQNWRPIQVTKRQNRSTQSADGIDDAKKSAPNPVSSDSDDANLPHDKDTLKVSFSLRIIGNVGNPFACDNPKFESAITEKITAYKANSDGLKTLAFRYAYNIANGRFLWRNRVCAKKITVCVTIRDEQTEDIPKTMTFDAYGFTLNNFEKNADNEDLKQLTNVIYKGLSGNDFDYSFITVDAYVRLGNGQHVFPSQEMNMGEKKKVLFKLDSCAAIHSVKIGNAIRTIDNWYSDAKFPIAIEPYGSVTQMGQAYRPKKNDLYTLMINWVNKTEDAEVNINDKNFVAANLIRGGVFGKSKEKKAKS